MTSPLFSVSTWDTESQAYTPQAGLSRTFNLSWRELLTAVRELRRLGYSAHRKKDPNALGEMYDDNDWCVLIERTDGKAESEILEDWKR